MQPLSFHFDIKTSSRLSGIDSKHASISEDPADRDSGTATLKGIKYGTAVPVLGIAWLHLSNVKHLAMFGGS